MTTTSAFRDAWSAVVAAYHSGIVNSECTLHSLMYAELRGRLPDLVVLCEPQIDVERHGCFVPDLVVLDETSVVAVGELKFVPHHYPVFEFDLKKLAVLAECRQSLPMLLNPLSGGFSDARFTVSQECLLVFVAIGRHDAAALDPQGLEVAMKPFGARVLPLLLGVGC